ncbi:hypothetical protein [Acinetobacter sp. NCu2D-2]|uniref:hypothetical protein n=1 Tax=Acinetobacter sp. NCu2D-2 TaxID=1608473 RepID=UPI000A9DC4D1
MKHILLISVFAVSLGGCVVSPYDDDYRDHRDRHGHYDKKPGDRDWKKHDKRDWQKDRGDWRYGDRR